MTPPQWRGLIFLLISEIRYLQEQAILRLEYKDWKNGAEYKFLDLFKEISSRIGIPVKEFLFTYTIEDARKFLKQGEKVSDKEKAARKELFVFLKENDRKLFLSGRSAREYLQKLDISNDEDLKELKGISVSAGFAKGTAKVILFKGVSELLEETKNFRKGDILITTMTQPDMVPLMAKASAIVTDQGGMTSHAAVIAREFRIPCVIRTYKATQVFKSGDLIEVDAQKGIVRKLR